MGKSGSKRRPSRYRKRFATRSSGRPGVSSRTSCTGRGSDIRCIRCSPTFPSARGRRRWRSMRWKASADGRSAGQRPIWPSVSGCWARSARRSPALPTGQRSTAVRERSAWCMAHSTSSPRLSTPCRSSCERADGRGRAAWLSRCSDLRSPAALHIWGDT